ncbi:CRISPR-associated endoribonuclease Cas6 [Melioribacter sp. Ez-97]|uniref:CRISPR-associated endoribonuclease Cas6 n=1 Tax=Melioribacter sp. Ez-97 TaxID=3423434 RepID=UPI003EDB3403
MRIQFSLTPNTELVPFDYQYYLVGRFHKWLGRNEIHDEVSLYSISWLKGGKMARNGFNFPEGGRWFIGFWSEEIGKRLIAGAMDDPDVCCGMKVSVIQIQEEPKFAERERFIAASPVFIRKYDENRKAIHLTFKDEEADFYLTEALKTKLKHANLDYEVKVSFDRSYKRAKTKLVRINGIENRANFCPVIIEGDPAAVNFAWNVGVGHSTGCGFGALE